MGVSEVKDCPSRHFECRKPQSGQCFATITVKYGYLGGFRSNITTEKLCRYDPRVRPRGSDINGDTLLEGDRVKARKASKAWFGKNYSKDDEGTVQKMGKDNSYALRQVLIKWDDKEKTKGKTKYTNAVNVKKIPK